MKVWIVWEHEQGSTGASLVRVFKVQDAADYNCLIRNLGSVGKLWWYSTTEEAVQE
jgi:hypothetical protein